MKNENLLNILDRKLRKPDGTILARGTSNWNSGLPANVLLPRTCVCVSFGQERARSSLFSLQIVEPNAFEMTRLFYFAVSVCVLYEQEEDVTFLLLGV